MERLSDPDFAFFLHGAGASAARNEILQFTRQQPLYDRALRWRTDRSQKLESRRLQARVQELRSCSFSPNISHRSRSIKSSFSVRMQADQEAREERRVIGQFLKNQTELELLNHPFHPNLSKTSKFKISRYLTRPIRIPHLL